MQIALFCCRFLREKCVVDEDFAEVLRHRQGAARYTLDGHLHLPVSDDNKSHIFVFDVNYGEQFAVAFLSPISILHERTASTS